MTQMNTCSAMNNEYEFACLGSGSSGNAFVVKIPNVKSSTCILWECGLKDVEIVNRLRENELSISDIKVCLISHNHKDHSQAKKTISNLQIPILSCESVLNDLKTTNNRVLRDNETIGIDKNTIIYAFNVNHDVESLGFAIIDKLNNVNTLLINDTNEFELNEKIKKTKFDYIFIECNHIKKQLLAILESKQNDFQKLKYQRQEKSHLSLIGVKRMLDQLDLSNTKTIFLTHLSKECCNDVICKTEIKRTYNINTVVCRTKGGFI